jgi:hypothetical protein
VAIDFQAEKLTTTRLNFSVRLLPDAFEELKKIDPRTWLTQGIPNSEPDQTHLFPLLAICLLNRLNQTDITIARQNPVDAFPRILSQAYYFQVPDPIHKQTMMEHYLKIADRIPVYQISFPAGFQSLGLLLDKVEGLINTLLK